MATIPEDSSVTVMVQKIAGLICWRSKLVSNVSMPEPMAEKLNITFVDTRHWNIELTFDGVHFTEEGHHSFAENLGKELRL